MGVKKLFTIADIIMDQEYCITTFRFLAAWVIFGKRRLRGEFANPIIRMIVPGCCENLIGIYSTVIFPKNM